MTSSRVIRTCETTHPDPVADQGICRLCWLAVHSRAYQRLWGLPETGEFERTAPAGSVRVVKLSAPSHPPSSPEFEPCSYRGEDLTGAERNAKGLTHTKKWALCTHPETPIGPYVCTCNGCGPSCRGYTLEDVVAPEPLTPPPSVGVAVGCYGMASLAKLQVASIRRTCGSVPILIADDCSPDVIGYRSIVDPRTTLWPNAERQGHYAGDLSVFWRALQWAVVTGLKYVCKISQRFLWTNPGWLDAAVRRLEKSGEATLMQACMDSGTNLYVRSECMLFDVAKWGPLYNEFAPRGDLGNPTELAVWHLVHAHFGERFAPWEEMPVDRYAPAPGTLWHCTHHPDDYRGYAASHGVELGADFHTAGSQSRDDWKRG